MQLTLTDFVLPGHAQQALLSLESIKTRQEVSLCTVMAMIYAHKKSPNPGIVSFIFTQKSFMLVHGEL